MSNTVIRVENLSKQYRLGVISGGRLRDDLSRWWARRRGKPDPLLKIDRENVYLNGAILGMSKAEVERKFDEACLRTGPWTSRAWRSSSTRRSSSIPAA